MAVLEKEAGGGLATDRAEAAERPVVIRGSGLRTQLLVGLAGYRRWWGDRSERAGIDRDRQIEPGPDRSIRSQHLAEDLESRYWTQLAETNVERARAMAESHSRRHQARIDWINEQRAQDMVTFNRGWEGGADS